MFNLKAEHYLKIILLFSFVALISAYFIEYVLGHQPCNLCLIERIPYGLSIVLIITILVLKKNQKFLVLSSVCGVRIFNENITKEDLLRQLNEKTISCKDVTFRIFGLSLTSINIVISLIFIITLLKIFIKYEKN